MGRGKIVWGKIRENRRDNRRENRGRKGTAKFAYNASSPRQLESQLDVEMQWCVSVAGQERIVPFPFQPPGHMVAGATGLHGTVAAICPQRPPSSTKAATACDCTAGNTHSSSPNAPQSSFRTMPARFWRFVCGRGWRSQLFVNTVRALDHSAA